MEFKIEGEQFPILLCKLAPGEQVIAQNANVGWFTHGIRLHREESFKDKMKSFIFGIDDYLITYKSYLDNQELAVVTTLPGKIIELNINNDIIVSEKSLLLLETSISNELFLQKKLGTKILSEEEFRLLKLSGKGKAYLQINGEMHEYILGGGDKMIVSPGHLVGVDYTCRVSVENANNAKNLFIGEELSNLVVYGPGKVYLQSMSIDKIKKLPKLTNK